MGVLRDLWNTRGGRSTAVDTPLPGHFLIPLAPLAMLLGTLSSSWAFPGAPLGALGHLSGGPWSHREPLGDAWVLTEGVQSYFKIIEKPLVFYGISEHWGHLEPLWGGPGQPCGVLDRGIFSVFAKDRKGSTAVDPSRRVAGVNGGLPAVNVGPVRRSRRRPAEE